MKAIVVETKNKFAIVLDKKGQFIKIKNKQHYKVGSEIEVPAYSSEKFTRWSKIASVAAAFIIVLGLSFGTYTYASPYSYVELDINPSIELTTNKYDKVINAEALNEDGKKLIKKLKWKNHDIYGVIDVLIEDAVAQGFFKTDEVNTVLFSLISNDMKKTETLEEIITTAASQKLEKAKVKSEVYVNKSNLKDRVNARNLGISAGKFKLAQKLAQIDPLVDLEEAKDITIKEMVTAIKEFQDKESTSEKIDKNNQKSDENGIVQAEKEAFDNRKEASDSKNENRDTEAKTEKQVSEAQNNRKTIINEIRDDGKIVNSNKNGNNNSNGNSNSNSNSNGSSNINNNNNNNSNINSNSNSNNSKSGEVSEDKNSKITNEKENKKDNGSQTSGNKIEDKKGVRSGLLINDKSSKPVEKKSDESGKKVRK